MHTMVFTNHCNLLISERKSSVYIYYANCVILIYFDCEFLIELNETHPDPRYISYSPAPQDRRQPFWAGPDLSGRNPKGEASLCALGKTVKWGHNYSKNT
jgi:hypothetical protein